MINLIAFVMCATGAIWHIYLGNIGWIIVESVFALLNFPFAIKWLKSVIHIKEVKVICPKCDNIMTYKNWFSWILHTPFHWFGKRMTKCPCCGVVSYMKRLK